MSFLGITHPTPTSRHRLHLHVGPGASGVASDDAPRRQLQRRFAGASALARRTPPNSERRTHPAAPLAVSRTQAAEHIRARSRPPSPACLEDAARRSGPSETVTGPPQRGRRNGGGHANHDVAQGGHGARDICWGVAGGYISSASNAPTQGRRRGRTNIRRSRSSSLVPFPEAMDSPPSAIRSTIIDRGGDHGGRMSEKQRHVIVG
jgi:hypothetical protein